MPEPKTASDKLSERWWQFRPKQKRYKKWECQECGLTGLYWRSHQWIVSSFSIYIRFFLLIHKLFNICFCNRLTIVRGILRIEMVLHVAKADYTLCTAHHYSRISAATNLIYTQKSLFHGKHDLFTILKIRCKQNFHLKVNVWKQSIHGEHNPYKILVFIC